MKEAFIASIQKSYHTDAPHIFLGAAVLNEEILPDAKVNLNLSMMNRHGLVAGATGSGKTRTLQLLAEQLSKSGVPVFLSDVKGDLSGLATEGTINSKIEQRIQALQINYKLSGVPVELYSLSGERGITMRATVMEFGPILLAKVLELNDTQTGVLTILFKYADDKGLPIVDLSDLKALLNYLTSDSGKAEIKADYGTISGASAGTILRKITALEQQDGDRIFGEVSFKIEDLFRKVDGRGVVSLLNVSDMQDKPAVFSTFLLSLLVELYEELPEAGDLDKPKLVFFLDEAHLLFRDASKAFREQVEQIIRLIRSKGVGVFFCSQMAQDIPDTILSQLGNRIQHVLRAFTPDDAKALKATVNTYPKSQYYEIDRVLTSMGIGQALITVLNEKGIPTEVAHTHLLPPSSLMAPLDAQNYESMVSNSEMFDKYAQTVDPHSAKEILAEKIGRKLNPENQETDIPVEKPIRTTSPGRKEKTVVEQVVNSSLGRSIGREIVRGIFGMLFGKKR